ncbi:hypothetical protein HK102_009865, partial [Quaeritorhiza haematococci]
MSWKGFSKAVARLPQVLAAKAGYAEETVDPEFNDLHDRFTSLEKEAKKLNEDARKFKDNLSMMLAHQASFGGTLRDVYAPVEGRSSMEAGEDEPKEVKISATASPALRKADAFAQLTNTVREQLLPELEVIERRIIVPITEFLTMVEQVKRLIIKRSHKLLDYDRHRESVKKLKERTDREVKDEKRLGQLETALDQATREYNNVNNILKQQLPVLFTLRGRLIDPCFRTLFWYQLKVYQTLYASFVEMANQNVELRGDALVGFEQRHAQGVEMLRQITLIKHP